VTVLLALADVGAGVQLEDNIMFDLAAAFDSWKDYQNNYGQASQNLSRSDESLKTTQVFLTVSYRY